MSRVRHVGFNKVCGPRRSGQKTPIEHDSLEKRNECLDDIRVALDQRLDGVRIAFPSCTKDSQL